LVPKAVPAPRPTKRARIVDDAGKGLVGVRVLARVEDVGDFRDPDEFERVELQTDADGAFAFPSVGSKSRCKVALVSTRWQFGVAEASLESEGRTWLVASADEVLRATSVGSIRGTLRAASGQTFPGARVGVTVAGPAGQYGGFFTASDESGRLEICLPIGDYQLVVRAADGRLWRIPVACSAGTPAEIPPLELHPVGEIRGVVRDAEGRPVAGVQVTLVGELADADREPGNFREYARTDRQGRFRARYLAVGKWSVLLSRHGEPAAAIELEADKVAEIELRGWVPATGTSTSSR
jgi:hypothetical protein